MFVENGTKKRFFYENKIDVIDLSFSYFKYLPKEDIWGVESHILILFISIIPLIRFLFKHRPQFVIGHLLTILTNNFVQHI